MADTEGAEGPGVGHEQRSRIGVGGSAAPTRSRAAAQRNGTKQVDYPHREAGLLERTKGWWEEL